MFYKYSFLGGWQISECLDRFLAKIKFRHARFFCSKESSSKAREEKRKRECRKKWNSYCLLEATTRILKQIWKSQHELVSLVCTFIIIPIYYSFTWSHFKARRRVWSLVPSWPYGLRVRVIWCLIFRQNFMEVEVRGNYGKLSPITARIGLTCFSGIWSREEGISNFAVCYPIIWDPN